MTKSLKPGKAGELSSKAKPSELEPRKAPSQKRAIQRVQNILDVVASLLDEVGAEAITTNLIAQKAEIPIGSLYQYFPNKHAILNAVGKRHLERVNAMFMGFLSVEVDDTGWPELIDNVIDAFANLYLTEPGFVPLWSNIKMDPELVEIDRENNRYIASSVSNLFSRIVPGMKENPEAEIISRIIVEVTDSVLSRWLREKEDPVLAESILRELKVMLKAYLTHYIEGRTL
ncbi:transcriptional regulator, TetR family [Leptospira fainei serovar Hurstbridge str. BUT 6]|uniref:Transcriptional regulator, TetR family n=1 Tax=Leptospira fainei serovar Hurstbridge str. BUT 6 TaxID=1193011 RepID=S3UXJ4_9LEPT|nr:TetR/AcrR family transcriptional regulator [Leptospira fainei]EPG73054.1 transcriptional regulator, TetR family [Leptospira fainei serovar Hurstbridge str. BUT 6]